jgi:hypothetical protein
VVLGGYYGVGAAEGGTSGPAGVGTVGAGTVGAVGAGSVGACPLLTNHQVTSAKTKRTTTTIIIFL